MILSAYIIISHLTMAGMANPIRLSQDGWFRYEDGLAFIPLGGFHGNVMPMSLLKLEDGERKRLEPYLWTGHLDLFDATEPILHQWFKYLADNGVNSLRLFPRARVGLDVLDLCGKVNPELKDAFHRAFAIAKEYNIRFLLQIMPEPGRTGYINHNSLERHVLPRFTQEELNNLIPSQKRFLLEKKTVGMKEYFTDPDVLACQKLFLENVLDWVAEEPQIFALEIYNEQGWSGERVQGKWEHAFTFSFEDEEIQWSSEIVKAIKAKLPEMPVCLSHPGFGVIGYDPLKWSFGAGVDFYSSHLYAGLCGAKDDIDFPAVTAVTSAIINAGLINFPGEWGVLDSKAPESIRRRNHRDAIWLTLLTGSPGFMQWEYDFPEEYKWAHKVFHALPKDFSPEKSKIAVEIGSAYREFQTNTRYANFTTEKWFSPWEFNRQKKTDANIRKIFSAYFRSLELGAPIRFVMDRKDSVSLDNPFSAVPERPIQVDGGYQISYIHDKHIFVGYLRNRKIENFSGHYLGVPVESPLNIKLDLPAGKYEIQIINLEKDTIQGYNIGNSEEIKVADKTSDDYVIIVTDKK